MKTPDSQVILTTKLAPQVDSLHTPTPWYVRYSPMSKGMCFVDIYPRSQEMVSGTPIATVNKNRKEAEDNALFIVRACNDHAADKAKIKALVDSLSWALQFAERFAKDHNDGPTMESCLARARALLKS